MEKKKGGCHCGKVRYEVELDLTAPVIECNCSICSGHGLLLSFAPDEHMNIAQGEENLTEYRFNKEKIAHSFCKTCGVEVFGKGSNSEGVPTYAVNMRTLDDIDVTTLNRMPYDGKAL